MEKLITNPEFFLEIIKWQDKLRITKNDLGSFFDTKRQVHSKARKCGIELMEKIVKKKDIDFINWLNSFCKKYQLNENWKQSMIDYIACGYYCPPDMTTNTYLDKTKNIIILELDASTTKEDFKEAWKVVREKLKELPTKKRKFSHRSFKNLENILMFNKLKKGGLKGLNLIGALNPNDDGDEMDTISSVEKDKKLLKNLKIQRQRTRRRGYNK